MPDKDVKKLLRTLEREGATIAMANSGHWKITNPENGRSVQIPASPGNARWIRNASTRLRRIGLLSRTARSGLRGHGPCR